MSSRQFTGTLIRGRVAHLIVLLLCTFVVGIASGQSVHVEWMEFETNGQSYLVLNAYEPDSGSAEIVPLFVEVPLETAPRSPEADAFLDALEYVADASSSASRWRPVTIDDWRDLLSDLTTRSSLWIYGRDILSTEVSDVRKSVYAAHGYPSEADPLFPHLTRGVVAALDGDRNAVTSLAVDFDSAHSTTPQYRIVRFANVGSKPAEMYESNDFFAGYASGAQVSLAPDEEIRRLVRFKPSLFSIVTGKSSASLQYAADNRTFDVLRLNGVHHSAVTDFSRSMVSAAGLSSLGWEDIALYHIAFALGGIILALLFIASRIFSPIPLRARQSSAHSDERLSFSHAFTLNSLNDVLRDSMTTVSHWKSKRLTPSLDRFSQFVRSTTFPADRDTLPRLFQNVRERFAQMASDAREFAVIWKGNLHQAAINIYLYREFNTEYIEPIDGRQCVDLIRQLSGELESSDDSADAAVKRLRREGRLRARRLGGDLDHELLPPTTTNFQILWALRLLSKMPAQSADDLQTFMCQWLRGADHVLEYEGREGIGPTIPEFMRLNV